MKIAVIGAGLTGLLLARNMQHAGWQVTVFDKARAVGGRITTKSTDIGLLDIGAQYFTARDPAFRELVNAWQSAGVVSPWDFSPYRAVENTLQAASDQTTRHVGVGGMSALASHLAHGLNVIGSSRVHRLTRESSGWQLHCKQGPLAEEFDWVALTLPLEQTRELLGQQWSEKLTLPDAMHLPCWAVGLATVGRVDPDIQGIFGDEQIAWVSRQSAKPGFDRPVDADDVWMVHFSPESSAELGHNPEENLPRLAVDWLARHTNVSLQLCSSYQHYWSYANLMDHRNQAGIRVDADLQTAVCGAWCCGGRVEGAFHSAMQVSAKLL